MKEFNYCIRDKQGLHARPAAELAGLAAEFSDTEITIVTAKGRKANAADLMKLMSLAVRYGNTVTIRCEGQKEEEASEKLRMFFEKNL